MKRKRDNRYDIEHPKSNKYSRKNTEWISPTKLRNYMLNDCLVDWLEEHHVCKKPYQSSTFKYVSILVPTHGDPYTTRLNRIETIEKRDHI